MKPKNFPARKLARQIAAEIGVPSAVLYKEDIGRGGALDTARAVRTKKARGVSR